MLSIMRTRGLNKKAKSGDGCLKNNLFVTAGEVAQDLGVSKPFAYKLVRQMNEELEAKGFMTIAGRVSRKYYEEKTVSTDSGGNHGIPCMCIRG